MPVHCIMVSERSDDLKFGNQISELNKFVYKSTILAKTVQESLIDEWNSIVFVDGDNKKAAIPVLQLLRREANPLRVFVITDKPLNAYPYLFDYPAYAHHIFRRYQPPALQLYSKVLSAALASDPFGLERYFDGSVSVQKIKITQSAHKLAAVEALQNFFTKQEINRRLAAFAARAADELIMNAIFDAPVEDGRLYKKQIDRAAQFSLTPREEVNLQVASDSQYVGLCVTDQFGSLQKEYLLDHFIKDYANTSYTVKKEEQGAGLGLLGTLHAGLSLLFIVKPGVRSDVMIFFPRTKSYKDFREGFRFLSINAP